ncbi:AraC family transcriptional regulator [uncultured Pigmentiphaga sp.]|uniref:AraC family transcriptional regulator n=1 Tax=uncultured Pigmentiphaga sp. TaxID=340361 RepID=UPI00260DFD73|nr:AraC family transcriptional regulator [uncultured Pigmentiphaga sp.]
MADRLAALMAHFPVSAQVFNTGALCGLNTVEDDGARGQLHLVRSGSVEVRYRSESLHVNHPSLLLFPRPLRHQFITDPTRGADMVCANLSFEGGAGNPVASALPDVICLRLDEIEGAEPVLALLFEEAFQDRCGRVALIERLFEVVMIQVLRRLMENGAVQGGLLSGLSHPRLRHALVSMHEAPAREWTLDELAGAAGMSRSAFATAFRETVGVTPGKYLQAWRVSLAQKALRRGRPLKIIAAEVGYGSEAALSRAFKAHSGMSPREWSAARADEVHGGVGTGAA